MIRRSQRLQEKTPTAQLESQMLNETFNNIPEEKEISDEDIIVYTSSSNGKSLLASIEKEFDLNQVIRKFYQQDKIYSKILENPKAHAVRVLARPDYFLFCLCLPYICSLVVCPN